MHTLTHTERHNYFIFENYKIQKYKNTLPYRLASEPSN